MKKLPYIAIIKYRHYNGDKNTEGKKFTDYTVKLETHDQIHELKADINNSTDKIQFSFSWNPEFLETLNKTKF